MDKKKTGRPKKEFDFNLFENLCSIHCTSEEIAGIFKINNDTLVARLKEHYGMGFSECFKRFSATGKASLRRTQFKLAEKNAAMCIWLGKQFLGQREPESNNNPNSNIDIPDNLDGLSATEINELYNKIKEKQN